jgi:hypothetical protein
MAITLSDQTQETAASTTTNVTRFIIDRETAYSAWYQQSLSAS